MTNRLRNCYARSGRLTVGVKSGNGRKFFTRINAARPRCNNSLIPNDVNKLEIMNGFEIDCELNYEVLDPSVFVFNIEAARTPGQHVLHEQFTVFPALTLDRYNDAMDNRFTRLHAQPGSLSVRYMASVTVDSTTHPIDRSLTSVANLPANVMPFLLASRYCESDAVFSLAAECFGALTSDYDRVVAICEWIRANIDYGVGTSLTHGTARDVLLNRTGVCRDFAHVSIALCRALNIPARFVTGHVQWDTPPPDFHAIFEAYVDGHWVLFDPTAMASTQKVVRIGTGRDAADVAFATIFGQARMTRLSPLTRALSPDEIHNESQSPRQVVQMLAQAA
jgi:Transglutaminase-like superfamily